jgi:hypothetical protein
MEKGEQYWVAFRPKASVARPGPAIEMPHDVAAARCVEHGQRACQGGAVTRSPPAWCRADDNKVFTNGLSVEWG